MGIETTAVYDPSAQARTGNRSSRGALGGRSVAGAAARHGLPNPPFACLCVFVFIETRLQEFILNTPNNEASKFWIGGVAQTARISAIFAQARRLP